MSTDKEIALEQDLVDRAYARLETMRERARIFAAHSAAHAAAGPERDALVEQGLRRAQQLNIGDESLIFGRIDMADSETIHIGRVAVYDEDHEPLVTDWRAPASIPFYKATPKETMNVVRRRHILGKGQKVVHLEDELLDREDLREDLVLVGEAALLNALERTRSGHMRDIVSTIQREQDEIIRAPLQGTLVVQGGPGTGKTAVALHRAAYLLYTYREKLARTGVLVVGPNGLFLRYIEQVLPSLGESATLSTIGGLVQGIEVTREDPQPVTRVKGDARMAQVIARACANVEQGLREPVKIPYEGATLTLSVAASNHMVKLARSRFHGTHNARAEDVRGLAIEFLYRKWHNKDEWRDIFGPEHFKTFESDIREHPQFIAAMEHMWPVRSGADIVRMLRTDEEFRHRATNGILSERDASLLTGEKDDVWSEHDVALMDEATYILGPHENRRRRRRGKIDREERFHIERLVDELQELNPIIRSERRAFVQRLIDQRLELENDDRDWMPQQRAWFGHVVVDEAQGLSPMQWRMIARRCPGKSMTVVGDLGQSASVWSQTWDDVLEQLKPPESHVAELSINYRSPEEISDLAARVLREAAPHLKPPRPVRRSGEDPIFIRTGDLITTSLDECKRLVPEDGTAAIIATTSMRDEIRKVAGIEGVDLGSVLSVISVDESRGLEFDVVVVVEPSAVVERYGLNALYVALTRPTKTLVVVHDQQLPASLKT